MIYLNYMIMRSLTSALDRCNIMVLNSVVREKLIVTSLRFILRSRCVRYCQFVNPFCKLRSLECT